MSKIALSGNASGTGTFTIEAPNSNNSRTMALPDSAGDLVVTQAIQTLTNKTFSGAQTFGTASLAEPTGTAPLFMCRAWVYFVASTGTPVVQASGNISSITDNGSGDYTFNFTTAMPDANYSFTGLGTSGGANYQIAGGGQGNGTVRNTTSLRTQFGFVSSVGGALSNQDPLSASIHIFR